MQQSCGQTHEQNRRDPVDPGNEFQQAIDASPNLKDPREVVNAARRRGTSADAEDGRAPQAHFYVDRWKDQRQQQPGTPGDDRRGHDRLCEAHDPAPSTVEQHRTAVELQAEHQACPAETEVQKRIERLDDGGWDQTEPPRPDHVPEQEKLRTREE